MEATERQEVPTGRFLVIPCSGIGKVHGLISREAAYLVTDELAPGASDVVCLALVVKVDAETLEKVRTLPCFTIDGCGKACAQKNLEIAGGRVEASLQVSGALAKHRGAKPGTASELTEEGWAVCRDLAEAVVEKAAGAGIGRDTADEEQNG